MASILFGTAITDARGSVGGTVFSRNGNGAYTRIKTQPINRNTISQQVQRSNFLGVSASWRTIGTGNQATWVSSAPLYPYINRVGVSSTYTGFQLYSKFNNQLVTIGEGLIGSIGIPLTMLAVAITTVGYTPAAGMLPIRLIMDMLYSDASQVVPDDTVLVIQATPALSAGVTAPKAKNFRTIATAAAAVDTSTLNFYTSYANIFGAIDPTNNPNIFIQIFSVSTITGQVTNKVFMTVGY